MDDSETKETTTSSSMEIDYIKQYENEEHHYNLLNDVEHERYKAFRRSAFNKNGIRKIISNTLNQSVNANFVISVAGVAKVFVGEIVETARKVMEEFKHEGGIKPSHVHEAYRRLYKTMPHLRVNNKRRWI